MMYRNANTLKNKTKWANQSFMGDEIITSCFITNESKQGFNERAKGSSRKAKNSMYFI
jgi:hypothetical protein